MSLQIWFNDIIIFVFFLTRNYSFYITRKLRALVHVRAQLPETFWASCFLICISFNMLFINTYVVITTSKFYRIWVDIVLCRILYSPTVRVSNCVDYLNHVFDYSMLSIYTWFLLNRGEKVCIMQRIPNCAVRSSRELTTAIWFTLRRTVLL